MVPENLIRSRTAFHDGPIVHPFRRSQLTARIQSDPFVFVLWFSLSSAPETVFFRLNQLRTSSLCSFFVKNLSACPICAYGGLEKSCTVPECGANETKTHRWFRFLRVPHWPLAAAPTDEEWERNTLEIRRPLSSRLMSARPMWLDVSFSYFAARRIRSRRRTRSFRSVGERAKKKRWQTLIKHATDTN